MKLSALISPGTWELVERLRPHLDVTIDLFDGSLTPLLPERPDPVSQALRHLPVIEREPAPASASVSPDEVRGRFDTALRTANTQLFSANGLRVGLFPLRHERTVVGILATAVPSGSVPSYDAVETEFVPAGLTEEAPGSLGAEGAEGLAPDAVPFDLRRSRRPMDDPLTARIERLGWSLRATIEADIETHERLGDEQQQSRWLSATLRFLEHLHGGDSDRDLAEALIQAAAIWGDVDARLYRRGLDQAFWLHSVLPAIGASAKPTRLPPAMGDVHAIPTRITSIAELEHVGWQGPHAEVLFMPVTTGGQPDWLLVVGGAVDARFERVLNVAARTLALRFDHLGARRVEDVGQKLVSRLVETGKTPPAQVTAALGELATALRATEARIVAAESPSGPLRLLACVGGRQLEGRHGRPRARTESPTYIALPMELGLVAPGWLEIETVDAQPFDRAGVNTAERCASLIAAWLAGVLHGVASARPMLDVEPIPGAFEQRLHEEIERASRFGLEAGVLVVDTGPSSRQQHGLSLAPVIDVVRGQLRAADALGRLENGQLAALLVQTDRTGVDVVATRLALTLTTLAERDRLPQTRVGRAAFPSGGETVAALIAAARADLLRNESVDGNWAE